MKEFGQNELVLTFNDKYILHFKNIRRLYQINICQNQVEKINFLIIFFKTRSKHWLELPRFIFIIKLLPGIYFFFSSIQSKNCETEENLGFSPLLQIHRRINSFRVQCNSHFYQSCRLTETGLIHLKSLSVFDDRFYFCLVMGNQ